MQLYKLIKLNGVPVSESVSTTPRRTPPVKNGFSGFKAMFNFFEVIFMYHNVSFHFAVRVNLIAVNKLTYFLETHVN
jgi:hypothetical protein